MVVVVYGQLVLNGGVVVVVVVANHKTYTSQGLCCWTTLRLHHDFAANQALMCVVFLFQGFIFSSSHLTAAHFSFSFIRLGHLLTNFKFRMFFKLVLGDLI